MVEEDITSPPFHVVRIKEILVKLKVKNYYCLSIKKGDNLS